jgi:predicted Fe-Mo cluster-binding NifX family protein
VAGVGSHRQIQFPKQERKGCEMKIAISAAGKELTSDVDLRFGRAKYFIVFDTDTNTLTAHDNAQNLHAAQGAGIQAAETVIRLDAHAVLTGNVGPKAFRVLHAAGIKIYVTETTTVEQAVRQCKAGKLPEISTATVEGHWA